MTFEKYTSDLINILVNSPKIESDKSLKEIVRLLRTVNTVEELMTIKPTINRLCVDSLESLDLGNRILEYTYNYSEYYDRVRNN